MNKFFAFIKQNVDIIIVVLFLLSLFSFFFIRYDKHKDEKVNSLTEQIGKRALLYQVDIAYSSGIIKNDEEHKKLIEGKAKNNEEMDKLDEEIKQTINSIISSPKANE